MFPSTGGLLLSPTAAAAILLSMPHIAFCIIIHLTQSGRVRAAHGCLELYLKL